MGDVFKTLSILYGVPALVLGLIVLVNYENNRRSENQLYYAKCAIPGANWMNTDITKFVTEGDMTKFYVKGNDVPVLSVKGLPCLVIPAREKSIEIDR